MPRRIRDLCLAALALAAAFAALTRIDDRVPARVAQGVKEIASGTWHDPGSPVGNVIADLAASPALDNVFMAAMLAAGVVLVFLMVRT